MSAYVQDPSEALDYTVNLVVSDGDTIASSSWTVASGLTLISSSFTTLTAKARISAVGAALGLYVATVHMVGLSGQEYDQSIYINVQERFSGIPTLADILKPALRRAGITMRPGIGPSPDQYQELIAETNRFLGTLNCSFLNVFHARIDVFPLTGATAYTIGLGGDFNMPRPMKIKQAVILSGGLRYSPLYIATDSDEWGRVTQQSVTGQTAAIYNDRNAPLSTLYFWPQGSGDQIEIYSWSSISNSFVSETDQVEWPDGLADAVVNNLALRAADLYPREAKISANVVREARRSLAAYQSLNGTVPRMVSDAPGPWRDSEGGFGGGGSIIMGGGLSSTWQLPINQPNGVSTVFTFPFFPREVIFNGLTQVLGVGFTRTGTNSIILRDDDTATTIAPGIGDDIFAK